MPPGRGLIVSLYLLTSIEIFEAIYKDLSAGFYKQVNILLE